MSHPTAPAEIGADEFAERRNRAPREAAAQLGFDCLLVCARAAAVRLDRYADVMYLTNHYSAFPFIPDLEGKLDRPGRISFVIVPAAGDALLLTDIHCGPEVAMPKDQIVVSGLMLEAVADALRQRGFRAGEDRTGRQRHPLGRDVREDPGGAARGELGARRPRFWPSCGRSRRRAKSGACARAAKDRLAHH